MAEKVTQTMEIVTQGHIFSLHAILCAFFNLDSFNSIFSLENKYVYSFSTLGGKRAPKT